MRGVNASRSWRRNRPQTHAATAAARSHLSIINAFPGTLPCPRFMLRSSLRLPWTRNKEEKIERRRRSCEKGSKPTFGGGVAFLFQGSLVFRKRKMIPTLFPTILRNELFACGTRERPDIRVTQLWVGLSGNHQGAPRGECGVKPKLALACLNLPRWSRRIFCGWVTAFPPPTPSNATRLAPTGWPTGSLAPGCRSEPVEIRLVLRQGQMGFH